MKCVIPGANVKILAKAIHALSKIGEEMYIEPQENVLSFRTVNMANSAYADFTFFQCYFSYYVYGDLQENDALKCKISMRSAMTVFKASNVIDKQVETCHIRLEPNASEILFILKYKNSITKTHLLPILDCEILQTIYNKDCASIKLSSQPRVLGDAIQNFHQHLIEITLEVSTQKLLLRNYVDDSSGLSNTTRTQVALGKGEFDQYDIGSETSITFCMKEFKSILTFAEIANIPITIYFEGAGRPVIFVLKNQSFEVNLVLSTLNSDADSQTETTINKQEEKFMRKRTINKRVSKKNNNKSNRIKNKSIKSDNMLGNITLKKSHSCFMEEEKEQNNSKEQPETTTKDNQNINKVNTLPIEQNIQEKNSSYSCDIITKFNKTSISEKKLINSEFIITKRKSRNDEIDKQDNLHHDNIAVENEIPNSPPPPTKKARLILKKCFQTTFDPRTLPGYDIVLAKDSDEDCSE
ncbi:cell cycle checkpoint control protein RAD9A [Apis cerana]|uniref:cell cycle checkpoint control protein RAD9A n=1 Tax=Apis cerana TaxID=7461 RepID=UPI002B22E24D|nr:cell cycle checkpoint control protein RAD9A [Apis cerana]